MKKKLCLFAIICNILLLISNLTYVEVEARSFENIKKSGELRICYTPWFGEDTPKEFPSPYYEIALAFSKNLHLKPITKKISWDEQFYNTENKVKQGEIYTPKLFENETCDLYSNSIIHLPWRQKIMELNWIKNSRMVIVVRADDKRKYKTVHDLYNKKSIVVPKTSYHQWFHNLNKNLNEKEKIKLKLLKKGGTVSYLLRKEVDFVILSATYATFSKLNHSKKIQIAFPIGKNIKAGFGFPKNSKELKKEMDRYIKTEMPNPKSQINIIFERHFGVSFLEFTNLHFFIK